MELSVVSGWQQRGGELVTGNGKVVRLRRVATRGESQPRAKRPERKGSIYTQGVRVKAVHKRRRFLFIYF